VETVTVVPAGAQLPASFAAQKWEDMNDAAKPRCLSNASGNATAILIDADGDGRPEVLLIDRHRRRLSVCRAAGRRVDGAGHRRRDHLQAAA
jgi:hypothetical protein